jgi:DUF3006 family protein
MDKTDSIKIVVDRVEGEKAVLVLYDDDTVKFNFPVKYLPIEVKEGDHVLVSFALDDESREAMRLKIEELLKQ